MKVQILMSTYNGEVYLREQLDSILNQKTVIGGKRFDLSLLIRDDGSKDNTMKILEEYQKKFPQITYIQGKNIGACKSFFKLMQKADRRADYIAFSDQDDIWNENKMRRAVIGLKNYENIPAMYASDLEIVNQNLETMKITASTGRNCPSFGNALVENICTGCTIVINRKLYDKIVKVLPRHAYMHDWWIYMTASCFGKVIYDKKPLIKYRQHETNTVGSAVKYWQLLQKRIRNFHALRNYVPAQVKEFTEIFELPEEKKRLAEFILIEHGAYKKRMKIFRCKEILRKSTVDTILYKIGYLFW